MSKEWENSIVYKRNLSGSYLVLPAEEPFSLFDEKLLLHGHIRGLLPVEKCYLDEQGEYWYNITGRQSLSSRLGRQSLTMDLLEDILLQLCEGIEGAERYLLDENCLRLDADMIFTDTSTGKAFFLAYPQSQLPLSGQFQSLMEFLLTRIDHKDGEAVKAAYGLYEKSLEEGFGIPDLKEMLRREEKEPVAPESAVKIPESEPKVSESGSSAPRLPVTESLSEPLKKKDWPLTAGTKKAFGSIQKKLQQFKKRKKEEEQLLFTYDPEEETLPEEKEMFRRGENPTVCLAPAVAGPEGILLYEGMDNLTSLRLKEGIQHLGSGPEMELRIPKETVSRFHASVEVRGQDYFLEDLNSTNGTFVNGEMLPYKEKRRLKSGDMIRFGDAKYRFL